MSITIYHNPRCKKSREGLAFIREQGIEPTVVEYMKNPLSTDELKKMLQLLGMKPRELMRNKEKAYREQNLKDPALSDNALIEAMLKEPKLIERPVVVAAGKAVLARPAEKIAEIL